MKRLTIFLILLGCIALSSHAWVGLPYDRNFNPRADGFTPCTIVPADSTLTTVFDGIEMSAMDYAEIYITHGPIDEIYKQADFYIVGFGPSPRLKSLDKTSKERQKLIIADNPFYVANFEKRVVNYRNPFTFQSTNIKVLNPQERFKMSNNPDCLADSLTFDFDLSEYACDFDVYFLILNTLITFDNAFSNFKFSDNIKSVNIYLGYPLEIGHKAFTAIKNIEKVDVRLMSSWSPQHTYSSDFYVYDHTTETIIYSDSFTQDTYDTALLETCARESEINEVLTNQSADNYSNNYFRFFKNWLSGVENISIDENPVEFTIQGRTIVFTNLPPQGLVNVYSATGASLGSYVADDYGLLEIDVELSGFYLIRIENTCYKVTIN